MSLPKEFNVRAYGAAGDGSTDDTVAFVMAIVAAARSTTMRDSTVRIPAGSYLVNSGVLSHATSLQRTGMRFVGDGPTSTTLLLNDDGASNAWFYDNASMAVSYRNTYEGIRFLGKHVDRSHGFKLTDSTGHEKQFKFINCRFETLNEVLRCEGSTNADECTFLLCEYVNVNYACVLSNAQSMLHNWISCRGTILKDVWVVEADGGGELHWIGGSLIHAPSDGDSMRYWLKVDGDAATSHQTGRFSFSHMRAELRGKNAGLVHWVPTTSASRARVGYVLFEGCNLATTQSSSDGTERSRDAVEIGENKVVMFRDCHLPQQKASANHDDFNFIIDAADASVASLTSAGRVMFDSSRVPEDLATRCSTANTYGTFIAINCISNKASSHTDTARNVVNFQKGWAQSAPGEAMGVTKVVSMKRSTWPRWDGSAFTGEYTVTLPAGCTPIRAVIKKPATGSGSASVQYHISSDDKNVDYVVTTSAAQNADHFASDDIDLGPLAADTVFRLHMSGTGTGIHAGGVAFIEYV